MEIGNVTKIAVIGASGMMGSQITEILTRVGGYSVYAIDINEELVSKGLKTIDDRMERFFVAKGKMTAEEKAKVMKRIKGSARMEEAVKDVDFVIEAAVENLALKKDIFAKLDKSAPPDTILASNTSYQNISELASVTKRPEKVVGTHFFNPPAMMKLVEVVRGARTSDETVKVACGLAQKLGKEPIVCRDISYGFLANRAYLPLVNEALQMVWERVASPQDIDKSLRLGYNLPMGPIELMDFVGGWAVLNSSEQDALRELGPEKGRLHPLIKAMIRAGYKKFYDFWNDVLSKW